MLDVHIDRVHSSAVCQAIGERLSDVLGRPSHELPVNLLEMMEQLSASNKSGTFV
jgi:hypothetical protein